MSCSAAISQEVGCIVHVGIVESLTLRADTARAAAHLEHHTNDVEPECGHVGQLGPHSIRVVHHGRQRSVHRNTAVVRVFDDRGIDEIGAARYESLAGLDAIELGHAVDLADPDRAARAGWARWWSRRRAPSTKRWARSSPESAPTSRSLQGSGSVGDDDDEPESEQAATVRTPAATSATNERGDIVRT